MAALTFDDIFEDKKSGALTFDDVVASQPSYLERVGGDIAQAGAKTADIVRNIPNMNPAAAGVQILGQGASVVSSPIAQGAVSAFQALPQGAQDVIKESAGYVADKARGAYQSGINALAETQLGKTIGDYGAASPNLQANLQEIADTGKAAANIAMTLGAAKATKPIQENVVSPALAKAGQAAKSIPLVADEVSGVSVNAALGGVPKVVGTAPQGAVNRFKGVTALKPEALDEVVMAQRDSTSALYKAVDATGATIKPATAQRLNLDILQAIDNLQINPAASPKTVGAVKELYNRITVGRTNPITGQVTQAPLTVSELDGFRKLLSNISGEDAVVANAVRDTIDNSLRNMKAADFVGGGADAPKLLFEARASAAKAFKMEQIADIIKKAGGDTRSIKAGFKRLTDKKGWERGFTKDEITAIKQAAEYGTGEVIERGLGTFGIDFGRQKNVALPVLTGSSSLAVPGGLPLVTAGTALRQTGKYAARGKAQNVIDQIRKR